MNAIKNRSQIDLGMNCKIPFAANSNYYTIQIFQKIPRAEAGEVESACPIDRISNGVQLANIKITLSIYRKCKGFEVFLQITMQI